MFTGKNYSLHLCPCIQFFRNSEYSKNFLVWKGKSVLFLHTIHPNNVLGFFSIHGSVADSVHSPLLVVIGTGCQFGWHVLMSQLGCYQTVLSRHKKDGMCPLVIRGCTPWFFNITYRIERMLKKYVTCYINSLTIQATSHTLCLWTLLILSSHLLLGLSSDFVPVGIASHILSEFLFHQLPVCSTHVISLILYL